VCNTFISEIDGPTVPNLPFPNPWLTSALNDLQPAPGTISAHLQLIFVKIDGGLTTDFYFDDARFVRRPLFADGFESGSASEWSATTPP